MTVVKTRHGVWGMARPKPFTEVSMNMQVVEVSALDCATHIHLILNFKLHIALFNRVMTIVTLQVMCMAIIHQ